MPGRQQGIARTWLHSVHTRSESCCCTVICLTLKPENQAAQSTWIALGYVNIPGDHQIDGISVITHRFVFAFTRIETVARANYRMQHVSGRTVTASAAIGCDTAVC